MIHKSIFILILMMIGLNILVSSCGIFSIDKIDDNFLQKYENQTSKNIEIVFIGNSVSDTVRISPNSFFVSTIGFSSTENNAVQEFVDDLDRSDIRVNLYANELFIIQWLPPAGSFGDTLNTPFNYNSWLYEPIENRGATKGQIIFTISDADLIPDN